MCPLVTLLTEAGLGGAVGELVAGKECPCEGPSLPTRTVSPPWGTSGEGLLSENAQREGLKRAIPGNPAHAVGVKCGCGQADEQVGGEKEGEQTLRPSRGTENNGQDL